MKRVIIKYNVKNNFKWLSHLELMHLFERLCKRCDIKIEYSQGFNPHPKIKNAAPKGLGVESTGEYLEVFYSGGDLEKLKECVSEEFMEILEIKHISNQNPKITKCIKFIKYRFYGIIEKEEIDIGSFKSIVEYKKENEVLEIKTEFDFSFSKFIKNFEFEKVIREVYLL